MQGLTFAHRRLRVATALLAGGSALACASPAWAQADDADPLNLAFRPAPVPDAVAAPAVADAVSSDPTADDRADPLAVPAQGFDNPIIPDAEFNAAIPSLDAPLESLDAFEARTRDGNAAVAAQSGDPMNEASADPALAALPALQDGDTAEAIADAPVTDPALAEPLPAIADFDVTPVVVPGDADEQTEVAYATTINGADVGGVRDLFDQLSALKDGDGEADNAAQVDARVRADQDLLVRILNAEGYYDGAVATDIARLDDGSLKVTLNVSPGPLYRFSTVTLDAPPTVPADLARTALPLNVGDPIEAVRVQGAEANLAITLPENGYPFAKVGQRDILLTATDATGDYTLPLDLGPRASFAGIETTGDLAFDADHVSVFPRFETGDLYDSRKVDDLRKALVATGLFSSVGVEPQRTGEVLPDGTEAVTLLVTQNAGPSRQLAASAGYGTGQGFRVEGSWTNRNLFPPEGALTVSGVAGTQEQGLGVSFKRNNAGRRDRVVTLLAQASHSDFNAFEAFTGTLAGNIAYVSTPIWQKRFTYAYGFELVGTNEQDYNFALGERDRQTFFIGALPGQVGFDTSDDLLNPTRGYRALVRVSPEVSLGRGTNPYARVLLEGSTYYPIGDSLVLAGRVRVGTIQGIDRQSLAPSRRYYGGGGGSVRGFGFQELGPKDPNNDPIGGRSLNEAAFEARYRFGNFGIVPFVDIGQVYESTVPDFSSLRAGVGIGGRFYTNFGPFRLDVATPLGRKDGESVVSVYVSIGQAF